EGCACPMGAVAKEFISAIRQEEGDVLIADTEAGVEHFGRGVDAKADVILMVADPSYESIQLSGKVGHMARQMGKPVYYILNKVNSQKEEVLRKAIQGQVIGAIPENDEIQMQGMLGMPLDTRLEVISMICDYLEREV
ncbi:MAG: nitrogenase reductase, partial [Lachnospiraceae bacterium]|nr:nitrogenase reductase [Lachnospiraceae bacterium]